MLKIEFAWGTKRYGFDWYWLPSITPYNLKKRVGVDLRWFRGDLSLDWYRI